ncbi:hypothetical protein MACH09_01400 [Vibrio sp. MACH09]|uniref:glycosyltransferase n=1 Tax=Vibrio sp. MACH09 TaxID=3025122 RepID=UPI002794A53E|nr:hypothetical protein MACH09_01400 [Vibrio sp. MACH09]
MSNYLVEEGHQVSIIIDRNRIAFPLHKDVKVYHLKTFTIKDVTPKVVGDTSLFQKHVEKKTTKKTKKKKLREHSEFISNINEWKRYLLKVISFPIKKTRISKLIENIRPDIVISHNMYYFLEHYSFYSNQNLCVVLHNSPKQVFIDRTVKSLRPINKIFQDIQCIGVSEGVSREMNILYPALTKRTKTIYNPVDIAAIRELSTGRLSDFFIKNDYIISVSSLAPGKRIERTIRAFSQLNDEQLYLVILGKGPEEPKLKQLAENLGIEERVIFKGFVENPLPYMAHAELLSFTSDYEGMGMVLIEALACNTPVVSTNCPSGPSEILTGELQKYLIDITGRDENDIVEDITIAMSSMLANKPMITDDHLKPFDRANIISQWEEVATKSMY